MSTVPLPPVKPFPERGLRLRTIEPKFYPLNEPSPLSTEGVLFFGTEKRRSSLKRGCIVKKKEERRPTLLSILGYFLGIPPKDAEEARDYRACADKFGCSHGRTKEEQDENPNPPQKTVH